MPIYQSKQHEKTSFQEKKSIVRIDDSYGETNSANNVGSILRHKYENNFSILGEGAYHLSSPTPYKRLQEITNELKEKTGCSPVFILIDMQKVNSNSSGIKGFFNKKAGVRTNTETEKRHLEILDFARENDFHVVDVNYLYSAFYGLPKNSSVVQLANKTKTYDKLRKAINTVNNNWRMVKNTEGLFSSNLKISPEEMMQIKNSEKILNAEDFFEKFPHNPFVLMGQLEDVCVRQTAQDLLSMGKTVLVSQDLMVDINNENNISGITNDEKSSWDYIAKNTGGRSEFKGTLILLTKEKVK